jgi:hypothetical protein
MDALAAGQLGPGGKPFGFHQVPHSQSRLHDRVPLHSFTGIEVDYDLVRMLDVLDFRIPGMQFDGAYFDEPEESFQVIHPQRVPRPPSRFSMRSW